VLLNLSLDITGYANVEIASSQERKRDKRVPFGDKIGCGGWI